MMLQVGFLWVFLLLVKAATQTSEASITLENLIVGDVLTISPFKRLPQLNISTVFFPQQPSKINPIWPVSRPFFRTKLLKAQKTDTFEDLLAYVDTPDSKPKEYRGNAFVWGSNKTLQRWDVIGDLEGAPQLNLSAFAGLDKVSCRQLFVVAIEASMENEHKEVVYCLQKEVLLKMEGLPLGGGNPIFYSSSYKTDGIAQLMFKSKFKYLRDPRGKVSLAYNFIDATDSVKPVKNVHILFVTKSSEGKAEEKVLEIGKGSFDDGSAPSSIVDFSIHPEVVQPGEHLSQLISSTDGKNFVVYLCIFKRSSLTLTNCNEVLKLKNHNRLISSSLIEFNSTDNTTFSGLYQFIVDNDKDILSTEAKCDLDFHKKPSYKCVASKQEIYDIADSTNIEELWIKSDQQGIVNFYTNKFMEPDSLTFSQIILGSNQKQFIYGKESPFMFPVRFDMTVGLNKDGFLSFYNSNSTKLIIDTSANLTNNSITAQSKVFYFDSENSEFDYFWLRINFIDSSLQFENSTNLSFTLTQEKTKLRFTLDQIHGPLNYLKLEKDSRIDKSRSTGEVYRRIGTL